MITLNSADNALKSFYLEAVTEALNTKVNPLLARIQKTTADVVGKDVKKLVKVGVSGGVSAGSETGTLPSASSNDYVQLTATLKNLYGTIEISDKAIRASATNEGAFVNLLNDEMESLIKSASLNFGRMLFGDGTGKIATISSVTRGDSIVVDNVSAFEQGMMIDIYDADEEELSDYCGLKVLSVDKEAKTVRLDIPEIDVEAVTSGCLVYVQKSYGYEISGLEALFANSQTLYGVSKQVQAMNAMVKSSVGSITVQKMEEVIDNLDEYWGSKVNYIVCSPGVKRALVQAMRTAEMAVNAVDVDGFKGIDFYGIPVVADRFCPKGTMYMLNTDDFKLHQLCDWQWLEGEDGKILKQTAGRPVYTATLVKYAELLCQKPCGQAKLTGITEA